MRLFINAAVLYFYLFYIFKPVISWREVTKTTTTSHYLA